MWKPLASVLKASRAAVVLFFQMLSYFLWFEYIFSELNLRFDKALVHCVSVFQTEVTAISMTADIVASRGD